MRVALAALACSLLGPWLVQAQEYLPPSAESVAPLWKIDPAPLGPRDSINHQTIYPAWSSRDDLPLLEVGLDQQVFATYRVWGGAEYLLWWFRKAPLPVPLVTTGAAGDPRAGFLDNPATRVLLGNQSIDGGPVSGGRVRAGFWISNDLSIGLEFGGLLFDTPTTSRGVASNVNGEPLLSRPIRLSTGEGVFDIAFPGFARGSFLVENSSRFEGFEANVVGFAWGDHRFAVEILGGVRYLELREDLALRYQVANLQPMLGFGGALLPVDTVIAATDSYGTRNRFVGGQLGSRFDWNVGQLSLGVSGKVGLGVNQQRLLVDGVTVQRQPGAAPSAYTGGMLATAANRGTYEDQHFAIVPEVGVTLGWWLTPRLRATAGYNLIYWTDVLRPGNHIHRSVNPALVPADRSYAPTSPFTRTPPSFLRSDFLAEGLTFGFDFRY